MIYGIDCVSNFSHQLDHLKIDQFLKVSVHEVGICIHDLFKSLSNLFFHTINEDAENQCRDNN